MILLQDKTITVAGSQKQFFKDLYSFVISAPLYYYEVKECLCDTAGVRLHLPVHACMCALEHDPNVQFLH